MNDPSPEAHDADLFPFASPEGGSSDVLVLEEEIPEDEKVKKKLGLLFWICTAWLALLLGSAIVANFLPLPKPDQSICRPTDATTEQLAQFKKEFPKGCNRLPLGTSGAVLGTDGLGRDLLSRVIYGARVSLPVGITSIVLGLLIGGTIGIVSGYFRGVPEAVLMPISDIVLAYPPLLLALALVTFSQNRSVTTVIMAIAIVAFPVLARLVRASTLVFTQREFVLASRTLGASHGRVILREVLPNVILPIFAYGVLGMAVAITTEGALAFLGLSVEPPTPTWGGMINEGRQDLERYPHITLVPCLVLFLTVLALNMAGDRLREYFDVKEGVL